MMTPLEALQDMMKTNVSENFDEECPFCGMTPGLHGVEDWVYAENSLGLLHHPVCSWLVLPQIIKAMEAAQAFVDSTPDPRQWGYASDSVNPEHRQAAILALFELLRPRRAPSD